MRRRVGRPGLIGTMARTAVVAGTASAVAGGVNRRQTARAQAKSGAEAEAQAKDTQMAEMQAELAQLQSQQQAAAPPQDAPPGSSGGDLMSQLEKLGELHGAGVLDDAEFAAAKAKLLGP